MTPRSFDFEGFFLSELNTARHNSASHNFYKPDCRMESPDSIPQFYHLFLYVDELQV